MRGIKNFTKNKYSTVNRNFIFSIILFLVIILPSFYYVSEKYLVIKTERAVLKLFLLVVLFGCMPIFAQSNTTLWYNRPAEYFEETLVLGNGKVGASVFGGVQSLAYVKVLSKAGNKCSLHYKGKVITFDTKKGKTYKLNSNKLTG